MVSAQGNYAGSVSRFLAYALDLVASTVVFTLALAGVAFVIQVVTSHRVTWTGSDTLVAVLFVVWQFFYFGYSWAVASRSFGMYVLGLRVVRADGTEIIPRQGVVRALVFPLSFLLLGLGFLGILVQHEHRALHDLIAGTTVVYAWDAGRPGCGSWPARPKSAPAARARRPVRAALRPTARRCPARRLGCPATCPARRPAGRRSTAGLSRPGTSSGPCPKSRPAVRSRRQGGVV
ncbi:MAG TPA: RDD family protein [Streptosporangiaceae bacterium]